MKQKVEILQQINTKKNKKLMINYVGLKQIKQIKNFSSFMPPGIGLHK